MNGNSKYDDGLDEAEVGVVLSDQPSSDEEDRHHSEHGDAVPPLVSDSPRPQTPASSTDSPRRRGLMVRSSSTRLMEVSSVAMSQKERELETLHELQEVGRRPCLLPDKDTPGAAVAVHLPPLIAARWASTRCDGDTVELTRCACLVCSSPLLCLRVVCARAPA